MIEINKIYQGDCIEVMKTWPENFVDTIITDPPYGIRFMGKAWDGADIEKTINSKRRVTPRNDGRGYVATENKAWAAGTYDFTLTGNQAFQVWCTEWAAAALKIVKPGGLMLVFGGTRTFHRMTAGLEDAGWQIRDCLMWLYGSGFPKSLDISKAIDRHELKEFASVPRREPLRIPSDAALQWSGYGTALKPAWEPIIVAMKPLEGTFAENAEKWGVAGLNVDGGRIGTAESGWGVRPSNGYSGGLDQEQSPRPVAGRWPANLILDEEAAGMLDGVSGNHKSPSGTTSRDYGAFKTIGGASNHRPCHDNGLMRESLNGFGDSGGPSRFFFVAKSSRAERNEGMEGMEGMEAGVGALRDGGRGKIAANHHPTVKPLELMKYLCQLTRTPTGGIVLDPFAGSGTTLWAAEYHNRPWIGIEMNAEYVAIAEARIRNERAQMKMAI